MSAGKRFLDAFSAIERLLRQKTQALKEEYTEQRRLTTPLGPSAPWPWKDSHRALNLTSPRSLRGSRLSPALPAN
jgi:hypothetical protein